MKKANIQEIGFAMVVIFVFTISFLVVKYSYTDVVTKITNMTAYNQSQTAVDVADASVEITNRYDYIVFLLLIGFSLAIIIGGWFVGGHPMLSFIYFVALVILIAVSAVFSYVWNEISSMPVFAVTVLDFPIINLILTNFPVYMAILGFIGMLVMFAKPSFMQ